MFHLAPRLDAAFTARSNGSLGPVASRRIRLAADAPAARAVRQPLFPARSSALRAMRDLLAVADAFHGGRS